MWDLVPEPGVQPGPPALGSTVLATGQPGKSLETISTVPSLASWLYPLSLPRTWLIATSHQLLLLPGISVVTVPPKFPAGSRQMIQAGPRLSPSDWLLAHSPPTCALSWQTHISAYVTSLKAFLRHWHYPVITSICVYVPPRLWRSSTQQLPLTYLCIWRPFPIQKVAGRYLFLIKKKKEWDLPCSLQLEKARTEQWRPSATK